MTCHRCQKPLPEHKRKWCSDNCRKRACEDAARGSCIDCGAALGVGSRWTHPTPMLRCRACWALHTRQRRSARIEVAATMYNEGKTVREIAARLGYGANSKPPEIIEARRRGLIGYRKRGYGVAA